MARDEITIVGSIGTELRQVASAEGYTLTTFRVATNSRYFDEKQKQWVESATNWYSVVCFRQLAEHAYASLKRGEPVIVKGRLKIKEWKKGERMGVDVEVNAEAIGHNLLWGTGAYAPRSRGRQEAESGGVPGEAIGEIARPEPAGASSGLEPQAEPVSASDNLPSADDPVAQDDGVQGAVPAGVLGEEVGAVAWGTPGAVPEGFA